MRVVTGMGENDEPREARPFPSKVDERTWRTIRLVMHEGEPGQVDITLLRPSSFVELHRVEVGAEFAMDLADAGVTGMARVLEIGGCPAVEESDDSTTRVVTATFKHHRFFSPRGGRTGGRVPLP